MEEAETMTAAEMLRAIALYRQMQPEPGRRRWRTAGAEAAGADRRAASRAAGKRQPMRR